MSEILRIAKYERCDGLRKQKLIVDYIQTVTDFSLADGINSLDGSSNRIFTDEECDVWIKYFCELPGLNADMQLNRDANNGQKVQYLMTRKGLTLPEAGAHLGAAHAFYHSFIEIPSCKARIDAPELTQLLTSHLALPEVDDLLDNTSQDRQDFAEQGNKGTAYGLLGVGVMDFFEDTVGTEYETMGITGQNYTYLNGLNAATLTAGVKDILIDGIYKFRGYGFIYS